MKTDYTRYRLSLMENIVFGMGYLVAAAVVCIIFYDSFLPLILMLPAGVYVRRLFEEYKRKRRQQELYFQFKDMVQALAASLSVGYSFENAFIAAHEELTRTYGKDALIVRELVVIMHEIRFGELAATGQIPFTPYYGTVDATPLFLILLTEYVKWTEDVELVHTLEQEIENALMWIDSYGDRDGDLFVE